MPDRNTPPSRRVTASFSGGQIVGTIVMDDGLPPMHFEVQRGVEKVYGGAGEAQPSW